ncbi:MAG: hypothetical protein JXR90_11910 [Spirochaetes bacterium]|nr:hypothetical protein [Spirochaetota bacterium]
MKSRKNDVLFFTICLLILFFASFLLYQDIRRTYAQGKTEKIGTITFKKRVAERKFTAQVIWDSVKNNSPVYNYDSIRTDLDSIATVNLNDGTEIELGENTLVILRMSDNKLDIEMQGNSLNVFRSLSEKNSGSTVTVTSGKSSVNLEEGNMLLTGDKTGDLGIDIAEGKAELVVNGKTLLLDKGSSARSEDGSGIRVVELVYSSSTPENGVTYVTSSSTREIMLSWEGKDSPDKELIISQDPFFNDIVQKPDIAGKNSFSTSLPSGTYYWKIRSSLGESRVSRFSIIKDKSSQQLWPPDNKDIRTVSDSSLVSFKWDGSEYTENYVVEIFSDKEKSDIILSMPCRGQAVATDKLKPGTYYWHVKSKYGSRFDGDIVSDKLYSFSLERSSGLSAPVTISRSDSIDTISRLALRNGKEAIYWQTVRGADYYTVEISQDKNFSRIIKTEKAAFNRYKLSDDLENGKFFWRVKAHTAKDSSAYSESNEFKIVETAEVELLHPAANKLFLGSSAEVFFRWRDYNRNGRYTLKISDKEDFSKPLFEYKINKEYKTVKIMSAKRYFWKVFLTDKDDRVVKESKSNSFNILSIKEAPGIVSPLEKVINTSKEKEIVFEWKSVESATDYKFTLYRKKGSKEDLVSEKTVNGSSYSYKDLSSLKDGNYFWEVTALDISGSMKTAISKPARASFKIETYTKLAAPKVILPRIIVDTE